MIIRKLIIKGKNLNLYPIGDMHIGSVNFDEERFNSWKEKFLSDKQGLCVIAGDIIDEDRPTTRLLRKSMYNDRIEAFMAEDKQHLDYLDRKVIPLLDFLNSSNCLGMIEGDHFRYYSNGLTSTQYICAKLKIPYLGNGQAIINITINYSSKHNLSYPIHIRHGFGYNKNQGGTNNRNQEFSEKIYGIKCFIRGHSHNCIITNIGKYEFDNSRNILVDKNVWLINTGSFRNGYIEKYTDYAEVKEYPNTNKVQVKLAISVSHYRNDGKPSVKLEDNAEYI